MTSQRLQWPRPFDLLVVWHGLFAGAWLVCMLSGDAWDGLHSKAGYAALGLLAVRFGVGAVARQGSVWRLPCPTAQSWKAFRDRLEGHGAKVLCGRTPLTPLAVLAVILTTGLAVLSGLVAWFIGIDDPHEVLANVSLVAVLVHLATVLIPAAARAGWVKFRA